MKCPRTILYAGIDRFYSQVAGISNNIPDYKPIAVVKERNRAGGIVVCASSKALAEGIEIGMGVRRAARKCPEAVFCSADYALYRDYYEKTLDIFSQFSPLLQPSKPGAAYIDITSSRNLFGDAREISELIIDKIYRELGLNLRTGCGSNKLIAFAAFNMHDRINIIDPADEKRYIKEFPIQLLLHAYPDLFKADQYMQRFQKLGIKRFGQLACIPDQLIVRQFGKDGFLLKRLANGIDWSGVKAEYPKATINIEHTYQYEVCEPCEIEPALADLSAKASKILKNNNYLAGEVSLKMFYDNKILPEYLKFKKPTDSKESILYALTKILRENMTSRIPVYKLQIQLIGLEKNPPKQICLFESKEKNIKIARTVDAIQSKFGDRAISTASLIG